ncbi:hypothetical protein K474DRAFT_1320884 [Panus rudis PR-1116 ss-1]|nr:hypothetical protein K474DRAFT_1320884 [Panus rudis PR-1116 ss-1]
MQETLQALGSQTESSIPPVPVLTEDKTQEYPSATEESSHPQGINEGENVDGEDNNNPNSPSQMAHRSSKGKGKGKERAVTSSSTQAYDADIEGTSEAPSLEGRPITVDAFRDALSQLEQRLQQAEATVAGQQDSVRDELASYLAGEFERLQLDVSSEQKRTSDEVQELQSTSGKNRELLEGAQTTHGHLQTQIDQLVKIAAVVIAGNDEAKKEISSLVQENAALREENQALKEQYRAGMERQQAEVESLRDQTAAALAAAKGLLATQQANVGPPAPQTASAAHIAEQILPAVAQYVQQQIEPQLREMQAQLEQVVREGDTRIQDAVVPQLTQLRTLVAALAAFADRVRERADLVQGGRPVPQLPPFHQPGPPDQ